MSDAREYVKARWEHIGVHGYGVGTPYVYLASIQKEFSAVDESAAWQAAKDFTVAREQEIAEIEEEIDLLTHDAAECDERGWVTDLEKYKRTLKRLTAIRDYLQRGMRKEK